MKVSADHINQAVKAVREHNDITVSASYQSSTGDRGLAIEGQEKVLAEFEANLAMYMTVGDTGNWDVDGTTYLNNYIDVVDVRQSTGTFFGNTTYTYAGFDVDGTVDADAK